MPITNTIVTLLIEVFQFQNKGYQFSIDTPLLGAIPEFDSMAVVSVLTALEDQYGFFIDDDEIDADVFETVGTLVEFVEQKLNKD
jgi:acyl carrier protein